METWIPVILEKGGPSGLMLVAVGVGLRWLLTRLDQLQAQYLTSLEKLQLTHAEEEARLQQRLDRERDQRLEDRDRHAEVLQQTIERFTATLQDLRSRR